MRVSIRVNYNDRKLGPVYETVQAEGTTLALSTKRGLDKFWAA